MSELFNNYPQPDEYIPNNRPTCPKCFHLDIMAGETASHSFEIPFNAAKNCSNYEVIYKLGIEIVIVKDSYELFITENENDTSIITCKLTAEETMKFANNLLDTKVQIKFYMLDGSIMFSDIYKVNVKDSLDESRKDPEHTEGMVYGINCGYTED